MKLTHKLGLVMLGMLIRLPVSAQTHRILDVDQILINLSQTENIEVNYDDLYQQLIHLMEEPFDLNQVTENELSSLPFLESHQIRALLRYRAAQGPFYNLYELQAVPELDALAIKQLLPFISIKGNNPAVSVPLHQNSLLLRQTQPLQKAKGYQDSSLYKGRNAHVFFKLKLKNSTRFDLGLIGEKDSGESFTWDQKSKGFDFYSAYIQVKDRGPLKNLIVGDYRLQMGQGLVYGSGYAPGKGRETLLAVRRNGLNIRPHHSLRETGFFRGFIATFDFPQIQFGWHASLLKQDGNISNDDLTASDYVSSLQKSGLHQTSNQIEAKNSLNERSLGGFFALKPTRSLRMGITYLASHFSLPLAANKSLSHAFYGDKNQIGSMYYDWNFENFLIFGEGAISQSGGKGWVTGMMVNLLPKIDLSMVYRNYDSDFHSFYGNAFGEKNANNNEKGLYWGLKIKPNIKHLFTTYYDLFRFDALQYQVYGPAQGFEYLASYRYTPDKETTLDVYYRKQHKPMNVVNENGKIREVHSIAKHNYWLRVNKKVTNYLELKSRLQFSYTHQAGVSKNGYLALQDVILRKKQFSLSTRIAIFHTQDYANRQYAYERDVRYRLEMPAYQGSGLRSYLLFEYKMNAKIVFWIKYGKFYYPQQEAVGTGLAQTQGPQRSNLRSQIYIKW